MNSSGDAAILGAALESKLIREVEAATANRIAGAANENFMKCLRAHLEAHRIANGFPLVIVTPTQGAYLVVFREEEDRRTSIEIKPVALV